MSETIAESMPDLPEIAALKPVVEVKDLRVAFNIANEQLGSFKEYFIHVLRRDLFYREFVAVDNLSFTVNKGDVFGIVGTNGSGKSTTLKVIAGVLSPSAGSVEVHGTIAPLIELGAGFDRELTAHENIYLNGALLGFTREYLDAHYDEIVAFAELEDFMDMPLKNYSSGMVSRIAFAIATIGTPDLLIVDEVLSVGDYKFRKKCMDRINDMIENKGTTVLIVSHSRATIERMCNKVLWLEKSHIKMLGEAKKVCAAYEGSNRLFGEDRFETAEIVARKAFKKAPTVVIANGSRFIEGLAGTPYASLMGAPLLITEREMLSGSTRRSIRKLGAVKAVILGTSEFVSDDVKIELEEMGIEVSRISADTRQEFCVSLFESTNLWGKTAVIASGYKIADALSVLPYCAVGNFPLFYANEDGSIDPRIIKTLQTSGFEKVILVGGCGCIAEGYDTSLSETLGKDVEIVRLAGENRYETSAKICAYAVSTGVLTYDGVVFASGANDPKTGVVDFSDAMAATMLCRAHAGVLLLVNDSVDGFAAVKYLGKELKNEIRSSYIVGDMEAINDDLAVSINAHLV